MTEESSTDSHLSVVMVTTGMAQIRGGTTITSSSSLGSEFYFNIALLVIGIVGTATNGLILYALVASKQHKTHLLIVHQNILDLFTTLSMIITSSVKLCDIKLTGTGGYLLCTLLLSDGFVWLGTYASVLNLAFITIERYLKVVHRVWSNNKLKNWVIYTAMAVAWIVSLIVNMAVSFVSSAVVNGVCYPYAFFVNNTARIINLVVSFLLFLIFYVVIILIFIFCYWRILVVIRRQVKVIASHDASASSTAHAQSIQMQSNVTKTMIFVCTFYAISWLPLYTCYLYQEVNFSTQQLEFFDRLYYATASIAFLYMCTNPIVYAVKFDPVKEVLLCLNPCKKNSG